MMTYSIVLLSLLAAPSFAAVAKPIGNYNVSDITVSGLSAGAFMAVQLHVAFSSIISGAAVYAGGPYWCAKGLLNTAMMDCMYATMPIDVDQLVKYTQTNAASKSIDELSNLSNDKVFLFSGKKDSVVNPKVMHALEDYYAAFIPAANIATNFNLDAEHTFPTLDFGNACTASKNPYISKCAFDGAGEGFKQFWGSSLKRGNQIAANLVTFDQTTFFKGSDTSIGTTGYVYVPTACKSGDQACHLHFAFHGCSQTLADVETDFVASSGYNEWAEANNIIVVYPQAVKTNTMKVSNPNGCWDWWAYTNKDYVLKSGVQMQFVKDIIDEVTGW